MHAAIPALIAACLASAAWAAPECTNEPRNRWMSEDSMRARLKADGYVVKKFKVVRHCYEIYGTDKSGRKVEIYLNPVTGQAVKIRVDG
ncbi:PepSY domain-containing protein [Chitinimonas arctica]|uniref:PepSY domain-containing protein n=1 Tax=Chitinimonas arctica TaxID=2594795 RepID=A0A516SKM4_9NEIS|nr:PepSY domain-containing protein [Chitinimonas arctica]QDQ28711.1 PepSY domain-containing protein [Chitinimonas arctica]